MNFVAEIVVMPLKEILDPQGKAVGHGLKTLGIKNIDQIRIGKHIVLKVTAEHEADAHKQVEEACRLLLANPIMEDYRYSLTKAQ